MRKRAIGETVGAIVADDVHTSSFTPLHSPR